MNRDQSGGTSLPAVATAIGHPAEYVSTLRRRIGERFDRRQGRAAAVFLLSIAGLILAGFALLILLMFSVPDIDDLGRSDFEQATIVYAAGGEELTRYYNQNRTWAPLDSIAPIVVDALIATEDRRFYDHWGIDVRRTFAAMYRTAAGERQGGSTITMQVARNAYPNIADDFVLQRKVKEWLTALNIEGQYSKEEILEIYLNTVPFNYDAYGIEAAARTYFSEDAMTVDTLQAATLIGMLKGTTIYNPIQNPESSHERRNVVLRQMAEGGFLSSSEVERLSEKETEIAFNPLTPTRNLAPYFADHVREWLSEWASENGYNLYRDGLRVYTTLDAEMQEAAEQAVQEQLDYLQAVVDVTWSEPNVPMVRGGRAAFESYRERVDPFAYFWESNPDVVPAIIRQSATYRTLTERGASEQEALEQLRADEAFVDSLKSIYSTLQAGFLAMNPDNGHIKAWVGGRDYGQYPFDHVADSRRQPGSTFKPFVYATALAQGISPLDSLRDEEIEYVAPRTNRVWSPGNFGSESGEMMTIREGLAQSKNTITAQLILEVGPSRVARMAQQMGIESDLNAVPSLALGTSEVTLREMVAAYATIGEAGTYHHPVAVTHIESADGERLATFSTDTRETVQPEVAYGLLDMMRGVIDEGTGVRMRSQYGASADLAGKTGTTQRGADGWFMLIHPDLVMGSWVGFPSPSITFRTRYWGQGSHNALRVVGDFYSSANLSSNASFQAPPGYVPPERRSRSLRAADTSGFELPDIAEDEESAASISDSILASLDEESEGQDGFLDEEGSLPADEDTLSGGDAAEDPFADEGDAPDDEFSDEGSQDDAFAEDGGGDATESATPDGESLSETERLNRQERQQSNVDEYLERLEDRDNQ